MVQQANKNSDTFRPSHFLDTQAANVHTAFAHLFRYQTESIRIRLPVNLAWRYRCRNILRTRSRILAEGISATDNYIPVRLACLPNIHIARVRNAMTQSIGPW